MSRRFRPPRGVETASVSAYRAREVRCSKVRSRVLRKLSSRPEALLFELLEEGMEVEIPMTGDSMSPFIRDFDVVTLAPLGRRPLRAGDVVAFRRSDGGMVVHRVVALAPERVLTRGDAAPRSDGWIDRGRIVGRVSGLSRGGRRVRLGLGPERVVIAFLSRLGFLAPAMRPLRWLLRR